MYNYNIIINNKYKNTIKLNQNGLITFFTPTYNRSRFLSRLEDCLEKQTSQDFVWIIVNDGSKDNTDEVVINILKKEKLPIKLISKDNGGKHSAFKVALKECETSYFQCMDDDDIYYPDAVKFYLTKWLEIKKINNSMIGAIRTLSRYPNGKIVANFEIIDGAEYDASTIETNYVMNHIQENWTCYDTEKLRSIDLSTQWMSNRHKFVTERIWQTRFARKYKCRYVNKVFREYRNDDDVSLSRGRRSYQHLLDIFLNEKIVLDEQYDLIKKYRGLKSIIIHIFLINCLRSYLNVNICELIKNTNIFSLKTLYILTFFPSVLGKIIVNTYLKLKKD